MACLPSMCPECARIGSCGILLPSSPPQGIGKGRLLDLGMVCVFFFSFCLVFVQVIECHGLR